MNSITTHMGHDELPRALIVGEWMGEAALAVQGFLVRCLAAVHCTPGQQADSLRKPA